jgi:hypothetical protein
MAREREGPGERRLLLGKGHRLLVDAKARRWMLAGAGRSIAQGYGRWACAGRGGGGGGGRKGGVTGLGGAGAQREGEDGKQAAQDRKGSRGAGR